MLRELCKKLHKGVSIENPSPHLNDQKSRPYKFIKRIQKCSKTHRSTLIGISQKGPKRPHRKSLPDPMISKINPKIDSQTQPKTYNSQNTK